MISRRQSLVTVFAAMLALTSSAFVTLQPASNSDESLYGPGGMQLYVNVTSLDNTFNMARALAFPQAFVNLTFSPDIHLNFDGVSLNFDSLRIDSFNSVSSKIAFVDETSDKVKFVMNGIDLNTTVQANMTAKYLPIPLVFKQLDFLGCDLELTFATKATDRLHWELESAVVLSIGSLEGKVNKLQQFLFNHTKGLIKDTFNFALKLASGVFEGYVAFLNSIIASESAETFDSPIGGLKMRWLMTQAPEISNAKDLITLNFDAHFIKEGEPVLQDSADRFIPLNPEGDRREQFYLHQSMVSSLVNLLKPVVNKEAVTETIMEQVPELAEIFGQTPQCDIQFEFEYNSAHNLIQMNTQEGILFDAPKTVLSISCAEDEFAEKTDVLAIQSDFGARLNTTWDNFVFYAEIDNQSQSNAQLLEDQSMKFEASYDWNVVTENILEKIVSQFNSKWAEPIDIKKKIPIVTMIAGILRNTIMTPFAEEGFLYLGFKEIADM